MPRQNWDSCGYINFNVISNYVQIVTFLKCKQEIVPISVVFFMVSKCTRSNKLGMCYYLATLLRSTSVCMCWCTCGIYTQVQYFHDCAIIIIIIYLKSISVHIFTWTNHFHVYAWLEIRLIVCGLKHHWLLTSSQYAGKLSIEPQSLA